MKTTHARALVCALFLSLAPAAAAAPPKAVAPRAPILAKMAAVNAGLRSYTAHIEVHAKFSLASITLQGTVYYRRPLSHVVFDKVPSVARSLVEKQPPSLGEVTDWPSLYTVTITPAGATTTVHLEPKTEGKVASVDLTVETATGLVDRSVWSYTDGSSSTSDQHYATVGRYQLVDIVNTTTEGHGPKTVSESRFSGYQLNVSVPDSALQP